MAVAVGHVLRMKTQQVVGVVIVVVVVVVAVVDEVVVEVAVEVVAEDKAFAKSVDTVSVQAEGTVPHRQGHRKLAPVGTHMQGRGVVVVQDEAGIEADARVDADKHYWGHHTHMAEVGHSRTGRVVPGADRNRTWWCDAQDCLPLSDQILCVLSQRTRSSIPNQPASGCIYQ